MKQLWLVQATVEVSYYMQDGREPVEVTHLVWAEDQDEIEALLEQEYPTDEYSVYRHVTGLNISPVLGAPEGFIAKDMTV